MAQRIGPDNSVRVAIEGTHNGVPWANVFWCQLTTSGTPSQADLDAWLVSFSDGYKTKFAPATGDSVLYTQAKATMFLSGGTVLQSSHTMTGNGGDSSGEVEDNAIAKVISWVTPVYWRGGKPRTYLPGVVRNQVTQNKALTSGTISALTTSANDFLTLVNALTHGSITGTALGFVSFMTGNAPRVPSVFYAFSGARIHARIGTQRRRLGAWLP